MQSAIPLLGALLACALQDTAPQIPAPQAIEAAERLGVAHVELRMDPAVGTPKAQQRIEKQRAAHAERGARIAAELEELGAHPWAGVYGYSDGLGVNVSLAVAPGSGVVYGWAGDLGLVDLNCGEISRVEAYRLRLKLKIDPRYNHGHPIPTCRQVPAMAGELFPVAWGERRYLIPATLMVPFCNAVNGGDPVACSMFPYRLADGRPAPHFSEVGSAWMQEARPELPAEYRPFLLEEPLEGALIELDEAQVTRTQIADVASIRIELPGRVDVGRAAGLLPGMILYPLERGEDWQAEVLEVRDDGARIEFRCVSFDREPVRPQAGWRLTTRDPRAASVSSGLGSLGGLLGD